MDEIKNWFDDSPGVSDPELIDSVNSALALTAIADEVVTTLIDAAEAKS